jgi:xylulokinase
MSRADYDEAAPGAPGEGLVLAVDLGTTSLKVGLLTFTGRTVWQESQDLETTLLPGGGAVQDAAHWWDLVRAVAARGIATTAAHGRRGIRAVVVTGQWSSTVPVDASGEPVGPCLLWLDSRGGPEARRRVGGPVVGYHPRHLLTWMRRTGAAPALDGCDPLGHRWWLPSGDPEVYAATRWLLEPVDYLTMRFTGRAAASPASMIGAWLTDNRRPDPGGYDATLVRRAGIDPDRLPPLVPNGSVLGPVMAGVARELGIDPGTPVIAGAGDAHLVVLGSGAVDLYETHLSLGTSSWVSCPVPTKKTDPLHQMVSVPSLLPGRYVLINNHETSGRCLEWLRGLVAEPDAPLSYSDLDALAARSAPGAGGVLFTPWLAGERTPVADRLARGGFHNLSLSTTRADLVRAVLEGVAYNVRWTFELVERFTRRRLDRVRIVGGGGRSDLWCQIHADVLGRTVEQVAEPENAGLRGAALTAALALGVVRTDQVRGLVPVAATFEPSAAASARYQSLYAEFPGLYRRQRRMFARINGRPQTSPAAGPAAVGSGGSADRTGPPVR